VRRLLLLPLVLTLSAIVPVLPAAAVVPVCTVHVSTKVTAAAPITWVSPTFTGCDGYAEAGWTVSRGDKSYGRITVKQGVSQGAWRYKASWPTGIYTLTASSSAAVPQNSTRTVVKFGSRISLTGHRETHLLVPLSGVVSRYVPTVNGFRRWAYRPVAISYKDCFDCPWKFLVMDRTDRYGVFSMGAVSFEARYYRARIGDTSTTWGRTSVPVHY
jgi:hypothetical protein